MSTARERRLFIFLILTVVWSVAMAVEASKIAPKEPQNVPAGCYFSGKPILDVELAQNAECLEATATRGAVPRETAQNIRLIRENTWMDFLFIVLYWSVFVQFARLQIGPGSKWAIGLVSLSAMFDVLENVGIFRGLGAVARNMSPEWLPRPFSLAKWTLLGCVFLILAASVWRGKGPLRRATGVVLVASGVLTLVGLRFPAAMVYATYGFAFSLLLILLQVWPYSTERMLLFIEYAFLLRFQIIAALTLAVALPLAYHFIPSLFVGVFDARGFASFLFVTWAAFQLAWTVMVTSRLVLVYGPERFVRAKSIQPRAVGGGTVVAFGALGLPLVVTLFLGTGEITALGKAMAAAGGLLLGISVLVLTASLHFAIEDPSHNANVIFPSFGFLQATSQPKSPFWAGVGKLLKRYLPPDLAPGILDTAKGGARLRSGHEMAAIALAIFLGLYAGLGVLFSPAWWDPDREPAVLFFLLVLLTVLTWLFSGAAFFLDRTRLPVLTSLLAVSLLTGLVGTDHKFFVTDTGVTERRISPSEVIEAWKKARGEGLRKVLVVATAGGGIRAAAWTAEVMTRLEEGNCEAASNSLALISSVSGGSVGSMFVVAPYSENGKYPSTVDDLRAVRFNAQRSSLSAVGWGLAYPDLARTAPVVGSFVPGRFDRGWSLENTWATGWRERNLKTPTMRSWREDVRSGRRPAVIFNATSSESGERYLISSSDGQFEGAREFFDLFPTEDIDVSTAARLSATFPYVSPLTRPSAGPIRDGYHVGDGGYYDNSGLLSAVEWLDEARPVLKDYEVILVLIDAQPGGDKNGSAWPWQRQLVGPVETLLHVRTSSQQVRESIELRMALTYLARPDSDRGAMIAPELLVTQERFLFGSATDPDPPLSWHLTEPEKKEMGAAWAIPGNQASWREVRSKLGCSNDPDILKQAQDGGDE